MYRSILRKNGRKTNLLKRNGKIKVLLCLTRSSTEHTELVGRIRETTVECQSVIMQLTTLRHRTQPYNARKLMENISVKLDLTKHRYQILKEARRIIEGIDEVGYVYADINCRLKVKMGDDIIPFNTVDDLKALIIRYDHNK